MLCVEGPRQESFEALPKEDGYIDTVKSNLQNLFICFEQNEGEMHMSPGFFRFFEIFHEYAAAKSNTMVMYYF